MLYLKLTRVKSLKKTSFFLALCLICNAIANTLSWSFENTIFTNI